MIFQTIKAFHLTFLSNSIFKKHEHLDYIVTASVNSSKNADKFEEFYDEVIDRSKVFNDYMVKTP